MAKRNANQPTNTRTISSISFVVHSTYGTMGDDLPEFQRETGKPITGLDTIINSTLLSMRLLGDNVHAYALPVYSIIGYPPDYRICIDVDMIDEQSAVALMLNYADMLRVLTRYNELAQLTVTQSIVLA